MDYHQTLYSLEWKWNHQQWVGREFWGSHNNLIGILNIQHQHTRTHNIIIDEHLMGFNKQILKLQNKWLI